MIDATPGGRSLHHECSVYPAGLSVLNILNILNIFSEEQGD